MVPSSAPAEIELTVTDVAHGGVFVARHEGRVVFVADTAPGERVLARVTEEHRSWWRAETRRVLEPSAARRDHIWPEAGIDREPGRRAGGAEFGHLKLTHQRELKRKVLADALQRMARYAFEGTVEAAPGDDEREGLRWRTRVTLHADAEGRVGPYAARSHRVVPVTSLPLADARIEEVAPLRGGAPPGPVTVVASSDRVVTVSGAAEGDPIGIVEQVGSRRFRLDALGFWQVHREAPALLGRIVADTVDPEAFDPRAANLDLYGGVGLLAAALADRFGAATRVTSVESSSAATAFAHENLAEWVGARALTDRVDRFLRGLATSASSDERERLRRATVILDPPRAGAGRSVVEALDRLAPAQIVYVACDPVALARDAGLFRERGWHLRGIRAFDLFPHTHHLEAVALLTPPNRAA